MRKKIKAWAILDKRTFIEAAHTKDAAKCAVKMADEYGNYGRIIIPCEITYTI